MRRRHPKSHPKLEGFLNKYLSGASMNYKMVIAIIIPLLVDQAFINGQTLFNTAMISAAGVDVVSAVSMVDSINMFLINVFIAVATGGTVIVAQYKGAGNAEMVSKAGTQTVTVVTLLATVLAIGVAVFHHPILMGLFGAAEPAVMSNAQVYIIGSALTWPGVAVIQAVCGSLRGVGDSKSSLWLSLVLNVSYVLFNLLFISIMGMGVMGLVLTQVISRYGMAVVSLVYVTKYNFNVRFRVRYALKMDLKMQKRLMSVGLPFGAEQLFFHGGRLIMQTFIVQMGTAAITANAIANSLSVLNNTGANALSIAVVTVVGQCMGRRDVEDARKFTKSFMFLAGLCFVVSGVILIGLFPLIIQLFAPPQELINQIFWLILTCALADPVLWSIAFVLPSALRAAGDAKFTSVAALTSMWVVRVVLGYVLGIVLNMGVMGVWLAMYIEWGARCVVFGLRFKGDKWYRHDLIGE
ncbi:MATE family efflux transporter [Gehongia tenuis]|uniref:Probable multidrug resistance protein NorM n=1 Tax=Gehongia tenuis TaxID=2763655 RepID=A0A926D3R0_9FIRM|nr:MATE family efflux transporter [Gehongia tenuis]MBC8531835.1 MATE family efflux transporter [Gehongia tenuis]